MFMFSCDDISGTTRPFWDTRVPWICRRGSSRTQGKFQDKLCHVFFFVFSLMKSLIFVSFIRRFCGFALFFQGDRGIEGPKGSFGLPGHGSRGDKVWSCLVGTGGYCKSVEVDKSSDITCFILRETQVFLGCLAWLVFQVQVFKEKR